MSASGLAGVLVHPASAPVVAFAGAALLASLPADGRRGRDPSQALPAVLGAATVLLVAVSAGAPGFDDGPGSLGASLLVAFLGLTVPSAWVGSAFLPGIGGRRLRVARATPAILTGFALLAIRLAAPPAAIVAVLGGVATASVATAVSRGATTAAASLRLLLFATVAAAIAVAGTVLRATAADGIATPLAAAGTTLTVLGTAALAGATPFGAPFAAAIDRAPLPLAPLLLVVPRLAAFAVLLRARSLLPHGLADAVDDALLASGLLGLLAAAGRALASPGASPSGASAGGFALGVAAIGLGGDAGLEAALLALASVALAVPASLLTQGATGNGGIAGLLSRAAVHALPPFGLFGAALLLIERAAVRGAPSLLLVSTAILVWAATGLRATARAIDARGAVPRQTLGLPARAVVVLHLVLLAALGLALPERWSDGFAAVADAFAR